MNTHLCRWTLRLLPFLLVTTCAATATEAKSYSAERFDSRILVLPGGAIEVTETVVFRFEDGTFTYVFREIPRRRTDSIEVLRASMDGTMLPFGDQPGQVEIRQKNRVRVQWNFAQPVVASRDGQALEGGPNHTFTLTYRVDGVVRDSEGGDLLAWRALPVEHDYAIDSATIEVVHPVSLARTPEVEMRRVGDLQVHDADGIVRVTASTIRKNGWVETWLRFAPGSIIASPPAWQRAERRAEALAPRWAVAAGLICAAGLLLLWGLRQRYDAPPREDAMPGSISTAPDDLPPAIAGALASNGRVSHQHAMATLVSLADRGAITIQEEPRRFGHRDFTARRQRFSSRLMPHEQVALDIVFTGKDRHEDTVRLSKGRSRLASRFGRFRDAVYGDMRAAGLIDPDRKALRDRLGAVSLGIILLGTVLFAAAVFLVREYRGWPFLVPAAFILVGVIGFIFQGATTPLANDGARRGARWRAYQQHLKHVARGEAHLTADSPARVLSIAVALGLASAWAKFVKAHPAAVPSWFSALSPSDNQGFPAFLTYAGTSTGGGGGVGGGGAAGGGASGAG